MTTLARVEKPTSEIVSTRRLPVAEIGDENEGDDDERRQPPRTVQPIGQRRDGEDDDEERNVQQDRGRSVDQEVDRRRHRVEEPGGVVLQPGDANLDQPAERQFRFGEPALQGLLSTPRPSGAVGSGPCAHCANGRFALARILQSEALLDRLESRACRRRS